MIRADMSDLIVALHEGILETPLWGTFLEELRHQMSAAYTTFTFRAFRDDAIVALSAGMHPPAPIQQAIQQSYMEDRTFLRHLRDGRVYALEELFDPLDKAHAEMYNAVRNDAGIQYVRFVQVTEPEGVQAWISCAGRRDSSGAASKLLASLVPHLRTALRLHIVLERQRFRSAVTSEAIERLNFGWVTLDKKMHIIDSTSDIGQILKRSDLIQRDSNNRLIIKNRGLQTKLQDIIHEFSTSTAQKPRALNISRDPWIDMLVAPIHETSLTEKTVPVAIVYFRSDRLSQTDRWEQLSDLFGLLPSEARVAWAIAQGMPFSDIAAEQGIALETVRSYSKKAYTKVGARGQAELAHHILTSVMALS